MIYMLIFLNLLLYVCSIYDLILRRYIYPKMKSNFIWYVMSFYHLKIIKLILLYEYFCLIQNFI